MSSEKFIIIADDDADDRLMFMEVISESGIQVNCRFAENGETLIEMLKSKHKPAFILLDLNMPRIDGREALKMLKKDEHSRDVPVIIYTTSAYEKDRETCMESGASDFFTKPSNFHEMEELFSYLAGKWL